MQLSESRKLRLAIGDLQRIVTGRYLISPQLSYRVATGVAQRSVNAFLCSYERSGRTWMSFCLAHYFHELYHVGPPIDFSSYSGYVPDADHPVHHVSGVGGFLFSSQRDIPFVATSHAPYKPRRFPGKVILVLRDPRDVLVSQYYFLSKYMRLISCGFMEFLYGNSQLAAVGIPGAVHALSRYLDSWVSPVLDGRVAVTSYESWQTSAERGLRELLTAIDAPVETDLVRIACERSAATNMRTAETLKPHLSRADDRSIEANHPESADPDARFVRSALVGGWRLQLDDAEAGRLCSLLAGKLTARTKKMFRQLDLPYGLDEGTGPI